MSKLTREELFTIRKRYPNESDGAYARRMVPVEQYIKHRLSGSNEPVGMDPRDALRMFEQGLAKADTPKLVEYYQGCIERTKERIKQFDHDRKVRAHFTEPLL